jgi:2'-5' RNA ligase
MNQRLVSLLARTAALALLLGTGTVRAQPVQRGNLFSAISFSDSPFGREWTRLRAEALGRFPGLKLSAAPDLHITVVYIGGDWKPEDLDRIRPLALVRPQIPVTLAPEVTRLGAHDQVVAVELKAASTAWGDAVTAAKATLNRLGLKRPESYDRNFRSHLTLAESRHNPPSQAEAAELAEFQSWMSAKVAENPQKFTVEVGPGTPVRLLLSNLPRPKGAPEYTPIEDFLAQHPASPVGP